MRASPSLKHRIVNKTSRRSRNIQRQQSARRHGAMRHTIITGFITLRIHFPCLSGSSRFFRPQTRRLYSNGSSSSSPLLNFHEETVNVEVGNNGYITLNILHPIDRSSPSTPPDAVLYLPPGPLSLAARSSQLVRNQYEGESTGTQHDYPALSPQRILASKTLSTVITLNYRLDHTADTPSQGQEGVAEKGNRDFTFPTPVHDTLAGFDWIFRHIRPRKLCVFGTNIGGSLALMLGLTEPRSVHAIVAEEPVCDWTGLDSYCLPAPETSDAGNEINPPVSSQDEQVTKKNVGRRKSRKEPASVYPDLVPLLAARRQLFRKPENYFDSFASPTLFVRSAGKDCPTNFPSYHIGPGNPIPVLEKPVPEHLDMDEELPIPTKPIRRRKALSRWPPYGLDYQMSGERRIVNGPGASRTVKITLPWVRLFVYSNKVDPGRNGSSVAGEISELPNRVEQISLEASPSGETESTAAPEARNGRTRSRRRPTEAGLGEESVLAAQGVEMVSLLHAACFFGRERSFGEERVKLVRVPILGNHSDSLLEHDLGLSDSQPLATTKTLNTSDEFIASQAGEWFHDILGEWRTAK